MLLMGAVIFGFMWLNQPSPEELEAQRKAAEAQRIEAQMNENSRKIAEENSVADTLTNNDIALLKSTIQQFGKATEAAGGKSFNLNNNGVNLTLTNNTLSGYRFPAGHGC